MCDFHEPITLHFISLNNLQVQCDDCDGWYHTMCVGANYNQLKDSDARFNCGCIS